MSSSMNLKLAANRTHSSNPAKTVYSPPKGFFRNNKSNLHKAKAQLETSAILMLGSVNTNGLQSTILN